MERSFDKGSLTICSLLPEDRQNSGHARHRPPPKPRTIHQGGVVAAPARCHLNLGRPLVLGFAKIRVRQSYFKTT